MEIGNGKENSLTSKSNAKLNKYEGEKAIRWSDWPIKRKQQIEDRHPKKGLAYVRNGSQTSQVIDLTSPHIRARESSLSKAIGMQPLQIVWTEGPNLPRKGCKTISIT